MTDVYILFVRPKRCVFADFFWVFEDFSIMIHDDLWFQEFCMTLWNVWKIRWNIDTTGPKRCCISRKTAGFFGGILLILDVQITFQKMLFKTATFQTRHFLIGETVHVVPETATLEMHFNSFYTTSHISNQNLSKTYHMLTRTWLLARNAALYSVITKCSTFSIRLATSVKRILSCLQQKQLYSPATAYARSTGSLASSKGINIKYILLPFPGVLPFQGNATLSKK